MAKTNDTRAATGAPEADEGKAASARRKPSRKLIIIVAAGLLGLGAIGGGGYYFFSGGHGKAEAAAGAEAPPAKSVVFLDMPDVLVNLSSNTAGSERTQYLKVKVTLELPSETMSAQIQPLMPRLMDAFQTYLRELRPSDLDGSAGLYRLKEELTRRVNTAIAPGRINAVLFKEIVVQ
jgi:flagellar protein FliL